MTHEQRTAIAFPIWIAYNLYAIISFHHLPYIPIFPFTIHISTFISASGVQRRKSNEKKNANPLIDILNVVILDVGVRVTRFN